MLHTAQQAERPVLHVSTHGTQDVGDPGDADSGALELLT